MRENSYSLLASVSVIWIIQRKETYTSETSITYGNKKGNGLRLLNMIGALRGKRRYLSLADEKVIHNRYVVAQWQSPLFGRMENTDNLLHLLTLTVFVNEHVSKFIAAHLPSIGKLDDLIHLLIARFSFSVIVFLYVTKRLIYELLPLHIAYAMKLDDAPAIISCFEGSKYNRWFFIEWTEVSGSFQ